MPIKKFNLDTPFPDIFPSSWAGRIGPRDFMSFRNVDHFRHVVSKITQKEDTKCGISYAKSLEMMLKGETDFPEAEQSSIRNLVRSNLHKRGLITEEVYENFRFTCDGTQVGVDVGKYAAGEPDCVMSPSVQYVDFFYELYINISYHAGIGDSTIRENVAKLLATIEELERKHIFIKVVMVLPINQAAPKRERTQFMATIPLFSHKTIKSVETMSSIVNERLLRKFFFAILENVYGDELAGGYGQVIDLDGTMSIGKAFDEIEFFENVVNTVAPEGLMA